MRTILVSGASGVVGYGVLRSLRKHNPNYRLIGTTIYSDSVAPAFCDVFEQAPLTSDERYLNWLSDMLQKHHVDMVIPGIEIDMIAWSKVRDKIAATGAYALLNNPDLIALCADKWRFYEKLVATGSDLVIESRLDGTFDTLRNDFGLPFLMKPRQGYASKGIVRVESAEVFDQHKAGLGQTLMAQPIVGTNDEEYTVSAFFDTGSRMLCHMGLKRKLAPEGYTEKAQVAEPGNVETAITMLAELLKPIGPTNFQFRVQDGQLKLLEINPRVSSATSIRTAFGYNESAMSVEYFLEDRAVKQPVIARGSAVRYIEDYIFYDRNSL